MPQDVLEVTTRFMRDPIRILVKKEELTLEGIRQFYIEVEREVRKLQSTWWNIIIWSLATDNKEINVKLWQ